jgi:hypothetical protein
MLLDTDRTSNTEIVGFLEVGNRSIILTGYKDAPQQRSIFNQDNFYLKYINDTFRGILLMNPST